MWKPGDRLTHRLNPDLGPGRVREVRGRSVVVDFPETGETLTLAADTEALVPFTLTPGTRARLETTGEAVVVETCEEGHCRLADGREVPLESLWPLPAEVPPLERLARGQLDGFEDFANRLDGLRLERLRQAEGLGSFLGGRIRLFPHQLYAAERATQTSPVRWLLADEVGLGKTVEACLILNRLIHTGQAARTLIVAPETLTLQWLGELWRKHHQIFVLLDDKRLADVARDYGDGFNPFEVHPRAIVGLDTLASHRRLTEQAVAAGVDLLVVDEAHHLRRPPGHPGNEAYRAIAPIAALGKNVLLLTATPLEDDAHGFFRLLQLLRPEDLPETESFEERLAKRIPLPPCTSATRRADIGGLPPRVAAPVDLAASDWEALARLERRMREPAPNQEDNALVRRRRAERTLRALASPAALSQVLDRPEREDPGLSILLSEAERTDPRTRWILEQAPGWFQRGEKTLLFVAHRETLERLKDAVERFALVRAGIFHEDLSPERRDIEVAQFRLADGPPLLISTEAGGEGRNFEFCHRLVLFDLPWNPAVVEQRIGRLDRIGRTRPTEIVYFRPPAGLGKALAALYEQIGLFEEPLGGLERELRHVAREVERVALDGPAEPGPEIFAGVLEEARTARTRVHEAAFHELHRDPYQPEMAASILARVPPDLDQTNEDVVLRAAARFGFEVEEQSGSRTWLIAYGGEALVDYIPGVPLGSSFSGTFDREEAVERESLEYFASGHPLVEGILGELEEGPRGRVAALQLVGDEDFFGLLALYRRGEVFEAVVVDAQGRPRPDLADRLTAESLRPEPVDVKKWTAQAAWGKTVRRMAAGLPTGDEPQAVAALRIRRRG
jgi:ATP-dependent helicase HepA